MPRKGQSKPVWFGFSGMQMASGSPGWVDSQALR
jgi:hypothetical protein